MSKYVFHCLNTYFVVLIRISLSKYVFHLPAIEGGISRSLLSLPFSFTFQALMPGIPGIPFVPGFPGLPRGPVSPGTPSPQVLDYTSSLLLSSSSEDFHTVLIRMERNDVKTTSIPKCILKSKILWLWNRVVILNEQRYSYIKTHSKSIISNPKNKVQFHVTVHHTMINENTSLMQLLSIYFT